MSNSADYLMLAYMVLWALLGCYLLLLGKRLTRLEHKSRNNSASESL